MPFWGTDRNVKDPKLLRNKSWISLVKLVVTIISVISNTKGNHFWSNYFWQLPRPVKLYRYFRRVATFRESLLWELYGVLFLQAGYRRAVLGTIIMSNQGNGRDISVRPTEMTRLVKVDLLQSGSEILGSDWTEMVCSIWFLTEISGILGWMESALGLTLGSNQTCTLYSIYFL